MLYTDSGKPTSMCLSVWIITLVVTLQVRPSTCDGQGTHTGCVNCCLSVETGVPMAKCSIQLLCSNYNNASEACSKDLQPNGLQVRGVSDSQRMELRPQIISNDTTYYGHIVRGVCGKVNLKKVEFCELNESVFNITHCNIDTDVSTSTLTFNSSCGTVDPTGVSIVSVIMSCPNCTDVYIISFTNCTSYCENMTNDSPSVDECSEFSTDGISAVQPEPDRECSRLRCLEASCVVCCPVFYGVQNSSCFYDTNSAVAFDEDEYCLANCIPQSLNCSTEHTDVCENMCDFLFDNKTEEAFKISRAIMRLGPDLKKEVRTFCARHIQEDCSRVRRIDRNCKNITDKCEGLCLGGEVLGFFSDGCPSETYDFCNNLLEGLLSSSNITDETFTLFVDVVEEFVDDIPPPRLVDTLEVLFEEFENTEYNVLTNESNAETFMDLFDDLFDDQISEKWLENNEEGAESLILRQLEELGSNIGSNILNNDNKHSFSFSGKNLHFSARSSNQENVTESKYCVNLQDVNGGSAEVRVLMEALCEESETTECSSVVTSVLVDNLAVYLHQALVNNQTRNGNINFTDYIVASELLSVQVFGGRVSSGTFREPLADISLTLTIGNQTLEELNNSSLCVFWNHSENSWSNSGVTTQVINNNTVRCLSEHLTSFAVLVSLNPNLGGNSTDLVAQSVLSYIGCSVSLVCLLATIFFLIVFRKTLNKGPLLYVHLNLCIALLLGYLFFVVGVETAVNVPGLCITLAALMQYFFLASFCWMLCEGIMLYLLVVRVFGTAAQRWYWFLIPGWGLPLPIVVISAAVLQENYISQSYCWLNLEGAYWTFVAPMFLIILINTVILVLTVISTVRGRKKGGAESQVNTKTLVITALKGAIVLLPLLGITWVIGLFAVNENTQVFAWIFVILNSLQGLCIFIIHVLRNKAFLKKIKSWFWSRTETAVTRTEMTKKFGIKTTDSFDYSLKPPLPSCDEKAEPLSPTCVIDASLIQT